MDSIQDQYEEMLAVLLYIRIKRIICIYVYISVNKYISFHL